MNPYFSQNSLQLRYRNVTFNLFFSDLLQHKRTAVLRGEIGINSLRDVMRRVKYKILCVDVCGDTDGRTGYHNALAADKIWRGGLNNIFFVKKI